jgi:hypothetical protein
VTEPKTTQNKQNEIEMNPKPKPTDHKFKKYLRGCRAFCPVKTQSQVKCIPRRTHRKQIATNNHKSTENNNNNKLTFVSISKTVDDQVRGIATEA